MMTNHFFTDFIERTKHNFDVINRFPVGDEKYEITQAINSFIGLIMIPISQMDEKNRRSFDDLIKNLISVIIETNDPYINKIRNGFAHGHFKFYPKENKQEEIGYIEIWDYPYKSTIKNFHATIYESHLLQLVEDLYAKLHNDYSGYYYEAV